MLKIYNESFQKLMETFNSSVLSAEAENDILDENTGLNDILVGLIDVYGKQIEGPKIQNNTLVWKMFGKIASIKFDVNQMKLIFRYNLSEPVEIYSSSHSYSEYLDELVECIELTID